MMFRKAFLSVLWLTCGCGGGAALPALSPTALPLLLPTPGQVVTLQVFNNSTLVDNLTVLTWCQAYNAQWQSDLKPWGFSLNYVPASSYDPTVLSVVVEDNGTQYPGSPAPQGFHDAHTAYVDMVQSLARGTPSATMGKEGNELGSGMKLTGPVAPYAYLLNGVMVGDVLLPGYFSGQAPYDVMGIIKAPGEIAPGGLNDRQVTNR